MMEYPTDEQLDHANTFKRGSFLLGQIQKGIVSTDWTTLRVVKGFLWGIARELKADGKLELIEKHPQEGGDFVG